MANPPEKKNRVLILVRTVSRSAAQATSTAAKRIPCGKRVIKESPSNTPAAITRTALLFCKTKNIPPNPSISARGSESTKPVKMINVAVKLKIRELTNATAGVNSFSAIL